MKPNPLDYQSTLERVVRRYTKVRPIEDSEEYTVAWIALIAACESFDGRSPAVAWLYKKMAWAIRDQFRKTQRHSREERFKPQHEPASREPSATRRMNFRELKDEIEVGLNGRTPLTRSIARQYLVEQLSYGEIARAEGVSSEAVRGRVRQATRHLRRQLERWVG